MPFTQPQWTRMFDLIHPDDRRAFLGCESDGTLKPANHPQLSQQSCDFVIRLGDEDTVKDEI